MPRNRRRRAGREPHRGPVEGCHAVSGTGHATRRCWASFAERRYSARLSRNIRDYTCPEFAPQSVQRLLKLQGSADHMNGHPARSPGETKQTGMFLPNWTAGSGKRASASECPTTRGRSCSGAPPRHAEDPLLRPLSSSACATRAASHPLTRSERLRPNARIVYAPLTEVFTGPLRWSAGSCADGSTTRALAAARFQRLEMIDAGRHGRRRIRCVRRIPAGRCRGRRSGPCAEQSFTGAESPAGRRRRGPAGPCTRRS